MRRSFGCVNSTLKMESGKPKWATTPSRKPARPWRTLTSKHHITQPGVIETSYSEAANLMVAGKAA
jgi:hypothetical protein